MKSPMTIHCVWGQMEDSYPGEHAPELLVAVDEWVLEINPGYLNEQVEKLKTEGYLKNFEIVKEINITVDQAEISRIIYDTPTIKGKVNTPHGMEPPSTKAQN